MKDIEMKEHVITKFGLYYCRSRWEVLLRVRFDTCWNKGWLYVVLELPNWFLGECIKNVTLYTLI